MAVLLTEAELKSWALSWILRDEEQLLESIWGHCAHKLSQGLGHTALFSCQGTSWALRIRWGHIKVGHIMSWDEPRDLFSPETVESTWSYVHCGHMFVQSNNVLTEYFQALPIEPPVCGSPSLPPPRPNQLGAEDCHIPRMEYHRWKEAGLWITVWMTVHCTLLEQKTKFVWY